MNDHVVRSKEVTIAVIKAITKVLIAFIKLLFDWMANND